MLLSGAVLSAVLAVGAASLVVLSGCKQNDGERCQLNEDCASGLCEFSGNTPLMGGYCKSRTTTNVVDMQSADQAVAADMSGGM
jgi:hypothetical protein